MKKTVIILWALLLILTACNTNKQEPIREKDTVTVNQRSEQESTEEVKDMEEASTETEEKATSEPDRAPVEIKVIAPYGTPALSLVKMVTEKPEIAENVSVSYELLQATDVLTSELINQKADIAVVPTNLAAVLHVKGAGYKLAGTSVMGSLYIASTEEITSVEDLRGKEISTFGGNLTPDAVLRYVLTENGINPDEDVTLNYFSGVSEVAADYLAGQSDIAMLAQPVLTAAGMKREGTKTVVDLQQAWTEVTGFDRFPQAAIIVSEALIEKHPEVVEAFLAAYREGIDWVNENPKEAGVYYEDLNLGLKMVIIKKAIPMCNLSYMPAKEAKETFDGYLNILYEFNPKLIGGKPVDDSLYYLDN